MSHKKNVSVYILLLTYIRKKTWPVLIFGLIPHICLPWTMWRWISNFEMQNLLNSKQDFSRTCSAKKKNIFKISRITNENSLHCNEFLKSITCIVVRSLNVFPLDSSPQYQVSSTWGHCSTCLKLETFKDFKSSLCNLTHYYTHVWE